MGLARNLRRAVRDAALAGRGRRARRRASRAPAGVVRVVVPARTFLSYREQAEGVAAALRALGRPAHLVPVKRFADARPRPGDRVLAFSGYSFPAFDPAPGVLYAAVNAEHYPDRPEELSEGLQGLAAGFHRSCHLVFEANESLLLKARALGLAPAGLLPFGWTPEWDLGAAPEKPRWDVAFLGRLSTEHRRRIFTEVARRYRTNPATLAWGRRRAAFLRDARIQLSLSQSGGREVAGHRFALMFANRCFLLTESLPEGVPFRAGVHLAEAPPEAVADAVGEWLAREKERRAIAAEGARFFREEYRLVDHVAALLPVLDAAADRL